MTEVLHQCAGDESLYDTSPRSLPAWEAQQRCDCCLVFKGDFSLFPTEFSMDQRCFCWTTAAASVSGQRLWILGHGQAGT